MNGAFVYALAGGICIGVALSLVFIIPVWVLAGLLCVSAVFVVLGRGNVHVFAYAIFCAALVVGCVRTEMYNTAWGAQTLVSLAHNLPEAGKKVTVAGVVDADPDRRDTTLHANIKIETINGAPVQGTLIAFFPSDMPLLYGQHVDAKGTLRLPDAFQGDGGNMFDYPHYLQVQGISAMLTSAQLASSTPAPSSLYGILFFIKQKFNISLERVFQSPLGTLMEGIILGERRGISPTLEHAFIVSSLIHIVVLSGHVFTLIADAIMRTLSFLPKKFRYPLGALFMLLFIGMVGASSTAIRAGGMAFIGLLARFFNRQSIALRALAVASAGMVLWNPAVLLWDTSFILSVLATFGLITCSPTVEHLLHWVPEKFELRAIATSTLSVQIFILPALLYYTGTLSFLALPANVLALPVLPWAMLAGFAAGVLNFLPGTMGALLAFVPAFFGQLLLRWIVFIAQTVEHIPYAATTIVAMPGWVACCMYVPLVIFALWSYRQSVAQVPSS